MIDRQPFLLGSTLKNSAGLSFYLFKKCWYGYFLIFIVSNFFINLPPVIDSLIHGKSMWYSEVKLIKEGETLIDPSFKIEKATNSSELPITETQSKTMRIERVGAKTNKKEASLPPASTPTISPNNSPDNTLSIIKKLGYFVWVFFVSMVSLVYAVGWLFYIGYQSYRQEEIKIGRSFWVILKRTPKLFIIFIISTLIPNVIASIPLVIFFFYKNLLLYIILLLIGIFIYFWLIILLFVPFYLAATENTGFLSSFRNGIRLGRGNCAKIFFTTLLMDIIVFAIVFVFISLITYILSFFSGLKSFALMFLHRLASDAAMNTSDTIILYVTILLTFILVTLFLMYVKMYTLSIYLIILENAKPSKNLIGDSPNDLNPPATV